MSPRIAFAEGCESIIGPATGGVAVRIVPADRQIADGIHRPTIEWPIGRISAMSYGDGSANKGYADWTVSS